MPNQSPPRIVFLDVNETLLDLSSLKRSITQALQGKDSLAQLWFPKLLQTSMVLTLNDTYRNFDQVAEACLLQLASDHGIPLTKPEAQQTLQEMRKLAPHPEVPEALKHLKAIGYTLIPLTNSSQMVLDEQMKHAKLDEVFEQWFSVEKIGLLKPHRHVYRWACQQVNSTPEECMMIAAHDWDIAGAREAGMRGLFISRDDTSYFPYDHKPEHTADDLQAAADYLADLKK